MADAADEDPSKPRSGAHVVPEPEPKSHAHGHPEPRGRYLFGLALSAVGVVYGDIGTSPLYAMRECFHGPHAIAATENNILGVLSLIVWSLILVISFNYLSYVMRADNRGEGGILSLMALVLRSKGTSSPGGPLGAPALHRRPVLVALGLIGAALLYGDGVLTPAVTTLSAVEGLMLLSPRFQPFVLPVSLAVLVLLFMMQRYGTKKVGKVFGPFMVLWFFSLTALGIYGVTQAPQVLMSVNPWYAVRFFLENGWTGFLVLGTVFLVVTGGEALYADMGHFGRRPIRVAWFTLVFPALVTNYFGQGALLLTTPSAAENPFFRLVPEWGLLTMVIVSTGASIIASQALISGVFSLTRQAMQLGYCPRMEIVHTSSTEIGQIYVPTVNWALLIGVILLVLGFGSSSELASAYGIAVSTTMVITAILAYFVARGPWGWRKRVALPVAGLFVTISLAFLGANVPKIPDGGWFPLAGAAGIFVLLTTWKRGREILARKLRKASLPLDVFIEGFKESPPHRVHGTAVFMTGNADGVPPALLHNLKHNKVLHDRVVLVTILVEEVPSIPGRDRVEIQKLPLNIWRLVARYGFMENPSMPEIIGRTRDKGLDLRLMETTFFLGRETLIPSPKPGMAIWRESLFAWMSRNARSATSFFDLPPNRVVELGSQVEL